MRKIGWGLVAFALCNLLACNWSPWGPHLAEAYPLLYDYRPLLAHQDLTGLEAGTHDIEFDVYVPRSERWSKTREQQLRNALQAAHVTTRTPAVTRLRFAEVPGLQGALGGLVAAAGELAGRLGIGPDDRVLVDADTAAEAGPVAWLLAPLVAGASLVLVRHPMPDGLAHRAATERVTATLGLRIDGIRTLGAPD